MKPLPVFLLVSALLLAGCRTTITNLTPSQQHRNAGGFYPFAVDLDIKQQLLVEDSLKAYVMIGQETYPMEKSPGPFQRWETDIAVPANQRYVRYRYKFDYQYNSIPKPRMSSRLSPQYQLEILDR